MNEHCWHMLSVSVLPKSKSPKAARALTVERCCWCGVNRQRTTRRVPDGTHGPHVTDPGKAVDVDVDDVPVCVERAEAPEGEPC